MDLPLEVNTFIENVCIIRVKTFKNELAALFIIDSSFLQQRQTFIVSSSSVVKICCVSLPYAIAH